MHVDHNSAYHNWLSDLTSITKFSNNQNVSSNFSKEYEILLGNDLLIWFIFGKTKDNFDGIKDTNISQIYWRNMLCAIKWIKITLKLAYSLYIIATLYDGCEIQTLEPQHVLLSGGQKCSSSGTIWGVRVHFYSLAPHEVNGHFNLRQWGLNQNALFLTSMNSNEGHSSCRQRGRGAQERLEKCSRSWGGPQPLKLKGILVRNQIWELISIFRQGVVVELKERLRNSLRSL